LLPLSSYYLTKWLNAFFLTQAVELPIYAMVLASRYGRTWRTLALAFGASAITHPIVWFVVPWRLWSYWTCYAVAESFAVLTEAVYLVVLGLKPARALAWSLCANAASVAVAELLRRVFGVVF